MEDILSWISFSHDAILGICTGLFPFFRCRFTYLCHKRRARFLSDQCYRAEVEERWEYRVWWRMDVM